MAGEKDYSSIAEEFAQYAGFLGVIGTIDGTYIPITGPSEFRDSYICIHLQAICDSSMKVLGVFSYHLLGDSVYSPRPYLLVPIRDNGNLTREQKKKATTPLQELILKDVSVFCKGNFAN